MSNPQGHEDPWQPAPDTDQAALVRRKSLHALLLGLLGLFMIGTIVPYGTIAGVACTTAGLVLGIRSRRMARAAKRPTRIATLGVVTGSIGVAIGVVITVSLAFFWNEVRTYQTCQSGALTIEAKDRCYTDFVHSLEQRLGIRS